MGGGAILARAGLRACSVHVAARCLRSLKCWSVTNKAWKFGRGFFCKEPLTQLSMPASNRSSKACLSLHLSSNCVRQH